MTPAMQLTDAAAALLFKKITPEELTPIAEKWYGILEGLLPDEGFVNGFMDNLLVDEMSNHLTCCFALDF